jgi:hypothetical protein
MVDMACHSNSYRAHMIVLYCTGYLWNTNRRQSVSQRRCISHLAIFGVGLPLFAYYAKLITDVLTDGVYLRFFPVSSRTIALNDIVTYEACQYSPLVEYGGWGIRFGRRKKRACTMGGNRGVELELGGGTRLLIGSQRPEELASALATAKDST